MTFAVDWRQRAKWAAIGTGWVLGPLTTAGAGTASGVGGAVAVALGPLATAAAGSSSTVTVTGTVAVALGPLATAGAGTAAAGGTVAVALGPLATAAAGTVPVTTFRLFPATAGPAAGQSYTGSMILGVAVYVTGVSFIDGYWLWVPSSTNSTAAVKCALWKCQDNYDGWVVPGTVVTSGTLTAGQWNYIPLAAPVGLTVGQAYIPAIGINANFPESYYYFSTGGAGVGGITTGILTAYSDLAGTGGTNPPINGLVGQGLFTSAGSDPSVTMPNQVYESSNFWVDLQIDTSPAGYSGSYRLWPGVEVGTAAPDAYTLPDAAVDYVLATEIHLSRTCTIHNVWFYSPAGTAQLPTSIDIWSINSGGLTGTSVYSATPTWSGAAGSGWVKAPVTSLSLPAGPYKVSVFNSAATPDQWSAKRLGYWGTSPQSVTGDTGSDGAPASQKWGANGLTSGPLYAPPTPLAATCYSYNPPAGTPTEPGQSTFSATGTNVYPNQYVGTNSTAGNLYQNYWVDLEVT